MIPIEISSEYIVFSLLIYCFEDHQQTCILHEVLDFGIRSGEQLPYSKSGNSVGVHEHITANYCSYTEFSPQFG